jgi:hypothetical protein
VIEHVKRTALVGICRCNPKVVKHRSGEDWWMLKHHGDLAA